MHTSSYNFHAFTTTALPFRLLYHHGPTAIGSCLAIQGVQGLAVRHEGG